MKYYTTHQISENIHETPEGYLICVGVAIARTGEMIYGEGETPLETDDDGQILINRDESEVFRPETMASFEGKPVTINHPTDFVSPENYKRLAIGTIQNVRRGDGAESTDLIADLLITDVDAINLVKNGLREVSCGYEADYIQTDDGHGKQVKIIGNHLALVEQGRAGAAYAINDSKYIKGVKTMTIKEKMKAIFAKAQDEAMKIADEGKEDDKKKDEAKDAPAMDELVQMVKDLSSKLDGMTKSKDADKEEKPAPKKDDAADDDETVEDDDQSSMEDRLGKLETSVSKILEMLSDDGETGDEDDDVEDDDFEESTMSGDKAATADTASRVEILSPGLKMTKDAKSKALKNAYATKDGKKVIDSLSGGKPNFSDATLFIAASEIIKQSRSKQNSKTKTQDAGDNSSAQGHITAEKMNEINAAHWSRK